MNEKNNCIVFVLFQFSVVVKGMERRLTELGYHVDMLTENFELVDKLSASTDLFIIYLPDNIMDDVIRQKTLGNICNKVKDNGRGIIILGERKYHEELSEALPEINECKWLDRPVDTAVLAAAVEKTIASGGEDEPKKRILIVDDDPSYAGMVREWIKEYYKADIVTAGMQAITFLVKNQVDLILLDYEMPVVNGPQVLQMLRQEPATAHIPVIFLTGVGTKEEVAGVMALKPNGYVLKSTTRDNLLHYIGGVI